MNKYLEKIASDAEQKYSGLSNWQTAGLMAGIGAAAPAAYMLTGDRGRAVKALIKAKKMGHNPNNWQAMRSVGDKTTDQIEKALMVAAPVAAALPATVAAHRQYQDFKNGDTTPRYGRGALIGATAPFILGATPLETAATAGVGVGVVGAHHLYQKLKNRGAQSE